MSSEESKLQNLDSQPQQQKQEVPNQASGALLTKPSQLEDKNEIMAEAATSSRDELAISPATPAKSSGQDQGSTDQQHTTGEANLKVSSNLTAADTPDYSVEDKRHLSSAKVNASSSQNTSSGIERQSQSKNIKGEKAVQPSSQPEKAHQFQLNAPVALHDHVRKCGNLSMIGRSATSFQTMPASSNVHAVSSSNISINTSTHKHTGDEEDNLHWTSEDEQSLRGNAANQVDHIDACFNKRFYKYNDSIGKSKYRTIHRGYDNDSGCEIAWTTYRLHNDRRDRLLQALDHFKKLGQSQESQNRNILRVFYNEVRKVQPGQGSTHPSQRQAYANKSRTVEGLHASAQNTSTVASQHEELIVVQELITGGSIREYLKKIKKSLRLNVIRIWCQKVLNALQFLHEHNIVHGELSCESIYINSNNGEIKVGDVGIKHIHTSIRSHELGACKQYVKEKDTLKVDIFCLGLTLLEILAASESEMSRNTLKYIIRIINLGQKCDLLDTLFHEPMRDFMAKALEEDPEKRYGVQQLLEHPFITQVNKSSMKLSEGLLALINEQAAYFKNQRALHQQSKIQNSLHMSTLNDSTIKKSLISAQQDQPAALLRLQKNQPNEKLTQQQIDQEEQEQEHLNPNLETEAKLLPMNSSVQPSAPESALLKKQDSEGTTRAQRASSPSQHDSSVKKRLPMQPEVASVEQLSCSPWVEPRQRSSSRQRGKTISYLELPNSRQKAQLIGTPNKKLKQMKNFSNSVLPATAAAKSGVVMQARRGKNGGGFPSATTYPSRRSRRKISSSSPVQSSNELQKSGKTTSGPEQEELKQQRRSDPSSGGGLELPSIQLLDDPSRTRLPSAGENRDLLHSSIENQELQMSVTSPTPTTSENILFFRIQIVMKGRKSDVKFPFDLLKDTPEAVALELQDYFLHSQDKVELPAHAIRAVQQEIQRGVDCHQQQQQQMTNTEGCSQTQTQRSYQNKVVISRVENEDKRSKQQPGQAAKPIRRQRQEETKACPPPTPPTSVVVVSEEEKKQRAAIEREVQRQLIEEAAQKREQREAEQRLAHDYLSMVALVASYDHSSSMSLPCNELLDTDSYEYTTASMQAEIHQMLKDGQLDEQEYQNRMQQHAIRKLSISQNSKEQQMRFPGNQNYYEQIIPRGTEARANPQMLEPQIEEPETGNSAAVIEFEPQIPHNNTTGERHEKLIEEQQKNGPFGQQEILHYRNSQDCKDPDLINFMHNPNEDAHLKTRHKARCEKDSAKSDAQESLWLLRELFPGYMEKYQEDYENNQVLNPQTHTVLLQQSSAVDLSQYTIDLSLASLFEGSHLSDSQKDQSQVPPGGSTVTEPFNINISVILPDPSQSSGQVQQLLSTTPSYQVSQMGATQPEVASCTQVAGDSSSQQLQIPSDLDEAQQQKSIAQQQTSAKNVQALIHRSFLQDCSERFIKEFIGTNMSGSINPANLNNKLNKKDQQPVTRPPSGQLLQAPHLQGFKLPKKLNNSQHYTEVVSFPHGVTGSNQMQSFNSHSDPQRFGTTAALNNAAKTSLTGTITELPTGDMNAQPSSLTSGGVTTTQEILQRTQEAGRVGALSNKTIFDVQISSQISDSQNSAMVTQLQPRTSKVQHAITYSKDQGQIQVISSSMETSTNANANALTTLMTSSGDLGATTSCLVERRNSSAKILKVVVPTAHTQTQVFAQVVHQVSVEEPQLPDSIPQMTKMTPSVMDIAKTQSQQMTEHVLAHQVTMSSSVNSRTLAPTTSFKGFPNMPIADDEPREEQKELQLVTQAQQVIHHHHHHHGKVVNAHSQDGQANVCAPTTISGSAASLRFNKPGGAGGAGPSQAAAMQELEKLYQIKQRGMRSEKLEKGNKQIRMSKTDIGNLQYALRVLGLYSVSSANSEIDSQTSMMDKSQISNSTECTGHYDSKTKTLVKRFQKREGLPIDGIVEKHTFTFILEKAIQQQRLISSVGRLNLESVQEQEEDQANAGDFHSHQFSHDEDVLPKIDVGIRMHFKNQRMVEEQSFSSIGRTCDAQEEPRVKQETQVVGRFKLHLQEQAAPTSSNDPQSATSGIGATDPFFPLPPQQRKLLASEKRQKFRNSKARTGTFQSALASFEIEMTQPTRLEIQHDQPLQRQQSMANKDSASMHAHLERETIPMHDQSSTPKFNLINSEVKKGVGVTLGFPETSP